MLMSCRSYTREAQIKMKEGDTMTREQPTAYIPSRDNYMTAGLYAEKPGRVLVAMVLNTKTGLPRTKRTWCNVHYNEAGYAYFVKYGYMYYMRDMVEVEY